MLNAKMDQHPTQAAAGPDRNCANYRTSKRFMAIRNQRYCRREDRDCGPARWCGNLRPAIDRQISAPVSLLRREDRGDARGMSGREIHSIAVAPDLIGTIMDVRPDATKEVLGLSWRAKRSW